jgi:hypothetical protein
MSKADKKKETLLGLHTKRADDFGKWYSEVRSWPPRVGIYRPGGRTAHPRTSHWIIAATPTRVSTAVVRHPAPRVLRSLRLLGEIAGEAGPQARLVCDVYDDHGTVASPAHLGEQQQFTRSCPTEAFLPAKASAILPSSNGGGGVILVVLSFVCRRMGCECVEVAAALLPLPAVYRMLGG